MEREAIRGRIRDNLAEIIDNEGLTLTDAATADDIPWDSVSHIKLLFAVEEEFAIAFDVSEIKAPSNVGDLIQTIDHKLQAKAL